jgi:hypothetical protein
MELQGLQLVDRYQQTEVLLLSDQYRQRGDLISLSSSSDIRKKENIVKIDEALDKVLKISGYTYNFKGDDRKLAGVIAQELEEVLPEVVYEIDDTEYGKTKAVRYGNIVSLLIEAIKELKAQLDAISK